MKYSILSRGDEISDQLTKEVKTFLDQSALKYDDEAPDLAISIGGDGTMLEAFHRYVDRLQDTAFVGVHTGRLGFYADWRPHEINKLMNLITTTPMQTVEYPLLEVTIEHEQNSKQTFLAVNECTVKTTRGSLVMNIEINQEHFETFRGDGLCISTPSGSTAYNKSLGGAILHPSLSAIQVAEMASINNRVYRTVGSPLILPDHHTCILNPINDVAYQITIDHVTLIEKDVKKITLHVAKDKVKFARYHPFPFWKRVKESFINS